MAHLLLALDVDDDLDERAGGRGGGRAGINHGLCGHGDHDGIDGRRGQETHRGGDDYELLRNKKIKSEVRGR